jgi:hypothetical protein
MINDFKLKVHIDIVRVFFEKCAKRVGAVRAGMRKYMAVKPSLRIHE